MKAIFLALSLLLTPTAEAAQIKAVIACSPGKALPKPLRSGWASLYEVISVVQTATVDGNTHSNEVALKSRYLSSWTKKEEVSTDIYTPGNAPSNDKTLYYKNRNRSPSLHLDSVAFHVTKYDVPFTAGPVPPGTYPAKAVLSITTSYYEKPGDGELKVGSLVLPMDCTYTVSYGQ